MSIEVEGYVFRGRGRYEVYDWDSVCDGKQHRMCRGIDFYRDTDVNSVRAAAHYAARKRGMKVHTTAVDGDLVVQFTKEVAK